MVFRVSRLSGYPVTVKLFNKSDRVGDDAAQAAGATAQAEAPGKQGGKGRATPKRRDAQAMGLHPVVPADRKAAKREARAKQDAAWERQRRAMVTGDDRYLPARDKGPIKRYIRDYVDARWSIGELFLPLSIVMLVLVLILSRSQSLWNVYLLFGLYGVLFLALIDTIVCWLILRRRLYKKFGEEEVKKGGMIFWYIFSRCFNLRRWRQPSPQNRRGEYPA